MDPLEMMKRDNTRESVLAELGDELQKKLEELCGEKLAYVLITYPMGRSGKVLTVSNLRAQDKASLLKIEGDSAFDNLRGKATF